GCGGASTAKTTPATSAQTAKPIPSADANAAQAVQNDYIDVSHRVGPSVVQIENDQGLGSGIVFDSKGDIVTNAHVVEGSTQYTVTFADGKQRQASLVGSYPPNDVAVIK